MFEAKEFPDLAEVKSSLNLDNLRIIHSRVEAYKPDIDFNGVVTRAFASLAKTINICNHLSPYLYAMKATISKDDQTTLEQYKHSHFELMVPFLDQNRCLIKINQKADIKKYDQCWLKYMIHSKQPTLFARA